MLQSFSDSKSLYIAVVASSAASFAVKHSEPATVIQLSHALARDVVSSLSAMGLLEDGGAGIIAASTAPAAAPIQKQNAAAQFSTPQIAAPPPIAPPPAPTGPSAMMAPAAPVNTAQAPVAVGIGQSVQTVALPDPVGGQALIPAPGGTFQPPAPAGIMNVVAQQSTPQGHSALGTGGVITPAIQMPSGRETIVAPAGEKVVQQIGGAQSTFVPEQVAR